MSPSWRGGRAAEGNGLLNRRTGKNSYPGFESRPLRFLTCSRYKLHSKRVFRGDFLCRSRSLCLNWIFWGWIVPAFSNWAYGYDNFKVSVYCRATFIVESFLPEPVEVRLAVNSRFSKLRDILSDEEFPVLAVQQSPAPWRQRRGEDRRVCIVSIRPRSYRVFKCQ